MATIYILKQDLTLFIITSVLLTIMSNKQITSTSVLEKVEEEKGGEESQEGSQTQE